ncbi:putative disease resistance RPP13-like protein 3 [Salvia miltiorrhiza]|uniref:putative disease resistance RPP13-like protein 3 n=1 Tax=Salvia miltiorrhiza TaxID=226208 RepID=UPI0025AD6AE2|nr:putative disease resistance RPP13-like protein 3 [Salvia miltiorrhiza]
MAEEKADQAVRFWLQDMTRVILGCEDEIHGVIEELTKLMGEVEIVKQFLDKEAKMLQKEQLREMDLKRLMKKVRYDVEDAIESSSTTMAGAMARSKCFRRFLIRGLGRALKTRIGFIKSRRLQPITHRIQAYRYMGIRQPVCSVETNQVPPQKLNEAPEKFVGLEDETENLISSLMEETEEVGVIAITGMAGIGKTTLASKIFHDNRIMKEFPTRIWLDEKSTEFRSYDSSNEIINDAVSPIDRLKFKAQLQGRRYLLVLDDIWNPGFLNRVVTNMLPEMGKVLITSCSNRITKKPHVLRFLNEKESWDLLQLEVFGELDACPETLKSTGQRIAQNCDGLPLAIVAVGNSLVAASSTKAAEDFTNMWWEAVSKNMRLYVAYQKDVFERLESSYVNLPQDMQECFLYLGVFPEDHEIPVRTLTRLWIAEGFVPDERGTILGKSAGQNLDEADESAEETADKYLDDLIDRNLVMVVKTYPNGQIRTCRLHKLIYGFCKFKASEQEIIEINGDRPASLTLNCRRLCVYSDLSKFLASRPKGRRVRSILSFKEKEEVVLHGKDSSRIHECLKLLRVLDCGHAKFTTFPKSLSKLIHLRYISVSCDEVRVIPEAVSSLRYLETLVVHTKSASVQLKANIWSMYQLRHLVTKAAIVLAVRGKGEAGKNLQTLSRLAPRCCTEDVFTRTPNLKRLGVRGNLADHSEAESFKKLERLEKLKLINEGAEEIRLDLHCFPPNLKSLTLSSTYLKWECMSTLGKIESLEILKLKDNAFVGGSWSCTKADGFGRLGFLLIRTTDLVSWEASDDSFPSLKCLVLKECAELCKIPLTLAKSLDTLDVGSVSGSAGEYAGEIKQEIARRQEKNKRKVI